jgi:tetratricopeptide (TPR) repeat protein
LNNEAARFCGPLFCGRLQHWLGQRSNSQQNNYWSKKYFSHKYRAVPFSRKLVQWTMLEFEMVEISRALETQYLAVDELLTQRNFVLAIPLAKKLQAEFPTTAKANFLVARTFAESGQAQDALEYAERACVYEPGNFQYLFYCGSLYSDFGLHEYALTYLQKSVGIQPNAFLSQLTLARCYFSIAQGENAIPHFRLALKLAPNDHMRDNIRQNLAHCLVASGQSKEALPLLDRLVKSKSHKRLMALCELASVSQEGNKADLLGELQIEVKKQTYPWEERRAGWIAIGGIFAKAKQHEKAFNAWQRAADLSKSNGWNVRDYETEHRELTNFYSAELFAKLASFGHETEAPVFITGMPRSGTTLTERIIAAHSMATAVGEQPRWTKLEKALRADYPGAEYLNALLANAKAGELRKRGEENLQMFRNVAGPLKARVVDKLSHNFVYAGYEKLIFSKARFIHIRRHPADTFVSTYQNDFNWTHGYAFDQLEYVKEYLFHERMMSHWKRIFGESIMTVYYEDLTSEPEKEAKRIIDFIGLPWEDGCLNFYERKATVLTFSMQQVRKPVYRSSVEKWRDYEPFLGPLLGALKEANWTYPPVD